MVSRLLISIQNIRDENPIRKIHLYYNRPIDRSNFIEEVLTLFPINLQLLYNKNIKWKSNNIPTYFIRKENLTSTLIQQYFFITLYRIFCYSLASENGNRLSSMEAAEKNIEERLVELELKYRIQRQNSITEEINDIISGFKTIKKEKE